MTADPRPADLDPGRELLDIARLVARLRPDWRDAEAFYTLRSEAIGRCRALARVPNGASWPPASMSRPAPLSRPTPPPPRIIVRERVRVVILPRHLVHAPRRHRFPRPPAGQPGQARLAL